MPNRLTRDELITAALDAVDAPSLDAKERPSGVLTGTLGVGWLQRALDFFFKHFPIKGVLTSATVTFTAHDRLFDLPANFLLDYYDGLRIDSREGVPYFGRMRRRGLSALLAVNPNIEGPPTKYAITGDTQATLRPVPDANYSATLVYYRLPTLFLAASEIPAFPDDQILVDFLELRYKEWLQMVPKGAALEYARGQVAALQKAGYGNEAEPDQIEFDREFYGERTSNPHDWLGEPHA